MRADSAHTTVASSRSALMRRAWAIFRETYHYPTTPFRSIGRHCFAWALRKAWAEARATAELAATPTERIEAHLAAIEMEIDGLKYRGFATDIIRLGDELRARARPLTAELFRRSVALPVAA